MIEYTFVSRLDLKQLTDYAYKVTRRVAADCSNIQWADNFLTEKVLPEYKSGSLMTSFPVMAPLKVDCMVLT